MTMYEFDWTSIPGAIPLLAKGMLVTLEVTLTAIAVGIVWGTLLAVARLRPPGPRAARPRGWDAP